MKKVLTLILALVISVVFTVPAFASSFLNGWNGGEKLNFSPMYNQSTYDSSYWSKDLVNKYGLTWYENPTRLTLKGEVMLLQLRTIQTSLARRGYSQLDANGQTLTNFIDKDSLVYSVQEEAKILKSIGLLPINNNSYMNLDYYSTRAEVAKGITAVNKSVLGISAIRSDNTFLDTTNHWAKDYISYAYQIGIMNGVNSSMFYPDNAVSIEQLLDIMDNEVGYYGITAKDVATAMNETFKVTCNLDWGRISPEYSSYNIKKYDYTQIKVNVYPYTNQDLEFTSYDESICKITSVSQSLDTVTVKGVQVGTTYIKANLKYVPNYFTLIPVYVTNNEIFATGITVTNNVTLEVGARDYLTTSVYPYNATDKTIRYYSGDTNIASVNSAGRVTGVGKGITLITVQTNNGCIAYCTVTVTDRYYSIPATGITVTSNVTLEVGARDYLTTSVYPYNATDKSIRYYSGNTNIVSVNSDGRVTGVNKGTAILIAETHNGYKAYCTVTVNNPKIYNNYPTYSERNFMYVSGYGESSYYNAFNDESMTFIVDTDLAINSVTLSNSNCYISQGVSSNSNGWQFTVKSSILYQNGETFLTVTLSNGEQLKVRICVYP
ncbi:MAG: Ig-like domain-containing protein [Clostridia bacterium]|nr:Ig-like domain-containing protein [Clostridia bacterium]MDD4387287.1 Ig-like domain-containing protein [Clostridia bacterium]